MSESKRVLLKWLVKRPFSLLFPVLFFSSDFIKWTDSVALFWWFWQLVSGLVFIFCLFHFLLSCLIGSFIRVIRFTSSCCLEEILLTYYLDNSIEEKWSECIFLNNKLIIIFLIFHMNISVQEEEKKKYLHFSLLENFRKLEINF